jgi:hypothetical protein
MANHLLRLGILAKFILYQRVLMLLILFVGIPAGFLCASAKYIHMGDWEPFFVIGGLALSAGSVMIYLGLVILMFPSQLITLASSRQYGQLPYIRQYLAGLMVCVLLLLQSASFFILKFGIHAKDIVHPSLIVAIMLIVGLVVIISFVQLRSMEFFYFFALPAIGWYLVPLLKLMPDFTLAVILLLIWGAFLSWWFSWHPKKYHQNLFVMNPAELNQQTMNSCWGLYYRGAVPENLMAGILFGQFGNSFYQIRLMLITLGFMGAVFGLVILLSPRDISEGVLIGLRLGIAMQIVSIGYNYSFVLFKNVNKLWLYFNLDRKQLLQTIERTVWRLYFKNLVAIAGIAALVSYVIPEKFLPLSVVGFSVLLSLLVTAIALYMVFIIYAKWRGNIKIFHWINGIWVVFIMGAGFLWLKLNEQKEFADYSVQLLVTVLLLLGVVVLMRSYAVRLWQKVDLVRVAI